MSGKPRRSWLIALILVGLVVVTVLISGPSPGNQRSPQGVLALRRFLTGMGLKVRDGDAPPGPPGVFVLLTDLRDPAQADDLLGWVRAGGTLLVADPSSATLDAAGISSSGGVGHYDFGPARLAPGCIAPGVAGVTSIAVDSGDAVLSGHDAGTLTCFPVSSGSSDGYEVIRPLGNGRIIGLGGTSALTNALLGQADNAAFALGLFTAPSSAALPSAAPDPGSGAASPEVVFGPAAPPGEAPPQGLWSTLPMVARVVLIQLALGLLAFALVRARRLGKPLPEQIPSPVPAGELVDAVGRLYRSARASGYAGETLRRSMLQQLRARLGIAAGDDQALWSSLALLAGRDLDQVRRLVSGPPPQNDTELIALGQALEELRQQVDRSLV